MVLKMGMGKEIPLKRWRWSNYVNSKLDSSGCLLIASCKPGKTKFKLDGFTGLKRESSGVQIAMHCFHNAYEIVIKSLAR